MECTVTRLLTDDDGITGAFGYWRESGRFVAWQAPSVVLATGGIGKSYKVTSNSWEYTGDGHSLALQAGATLVNMEFVQFHPTGMVWPPSVRGHPGDRERPRRRRHPEELRRQPLHVRLHPRLLPQGDGGDRGRGRPLVRRQEEQPASARAAPPRRGRPRDQQRGEGRPRHRRTAASSSTSPPAGRRSTSASGCRRCTTSSRSWPRSTSPPSRWRSGPTCHYVMGGVEVDPDTEAARRAGPVRRRRGGRRHARLQPARRQLAVRPAGLRTAGRAGRRRARAAGTSAGRRAAGRRAGRRRAGRRSRRSTGRAARTRTPCSTTCSRRCTTWSASSAPRAEMEQALERIAALKERVANLSVEGHRQYNPGWHLALDLPHMLRRQRVHRPGRAGAQESRGGHTRDDFPGARPGVGRRSTSSARPTPDGGVAGQTPAAAADAARARRDLRGGPA